jgi:hypothetical protein
MLSVVMPSAVMPSVVMLSVVKLSVVMLNVVMLSVVAPLRLLSNFFALLLKIIHFKDRSCEIRSGLVNFG